MPLLNESTVVFLAIIVFVLSSIEQVCACLAVLFKRLKRMAILLRCDISESHRAFLASRRIAIVASVVPLRPLVDYVELVCHVSPPGDETAKMAGMKLRFRFEGKCRGKVKVWWHRPRKYRNRYPYHKFGLGAVEVGHGLKAFDADFLAQSDPKSFVIPPGNCWVEHDFIGDDLLGGCLNIYVLAEFPCSGRFCVSLSATTDQQDPEEETGPPTEQERQYAMDLEAARWMNPEYQRDILGVPLDEYLEGEYSDPDSSYDSDRPDYLGGESLEEYYEH